MNTLNNAAKIDFVKNILTGVKFHSDFADGMEYNDPILSESFDELSPEVILTVKDNVWDLHKKFKDTDIHAVLEGYVKFIGRSHTNATALVIHLKADEDWEQHHDLSKLTGLKFKLA